MDTEPLARRIAELTSERKSLDVTVIDLRGQSAYAEFLVICSGTSDRHVQAIAEFAVKELRKEGVRPVGVEGVREGQWALVDLGGVVLHVFHQFTREVYALEALWKGMPHLDLDLTLAAEAG